MATKVSFVTFCGMSTNELVALNPRPSVNRTLVLRLQQNPVFDGTGSIALSGYCKALSFWYPENSKRREQDRLEGDSEQGKFTGNVHDVADEMVNQQTEVRQESHLEHLRRQNQLTQLNSGDRTRG